MGDISPKNEYLTAEKIFSNSITIWSINTKKELRTLPALKSRITKVSFSSCSKFVGVSCKDKQIVIWEVASGREVKRADVENKSLNELLEAQQENAKQANVPKPALAPSAN